MRLVVGALRKKYDQALIGLRDSDTAKAASLAVAMIANNVIALGSTFVFARLIGDYGSLAALVSYLLILTVVGQAMQVATAREGVLGHLGVGKDLMATIFHVLGIDQQQQYVDQSGRPQFLLAEGAKPIAELV